MPYSTLLVPVETDPETDCPLALAVDLANQFEAQLIGIGVEQWRAPTADADYSTVAFLAAERARVETNLKQAEARFRTAAAAVRQGSNWRSAVQFPITEIAAEARIADLVVTGRSRRNGASDYSVATPGALVLQSGRPIIVVPPGVAILTLQSVVIAWKDTREARRAVADALPILNRAESVLVMEVCNLDDARMAETRHADVAQYLLRHGVRASTQVCHEEKGVDAAKQFLELAKQHQADLMVAGAYGHSRLQEWVLGGFTRVLLTQTDCAVLLSH